MAIGPMTVGPGQRTLVIAEAGVNHNGCIETARRLVELAARAGADAVKFQRFCAEELATASAPTARYQRAAGGADSQRAMLAALELDLEAFRRLRDDCQEHGILFLATPFSLRNVEELVELGVPAIKIASADLRYPQLLEAAAATELPLIVSTGAAQAEEIDAGVRLLAAAGAESRLVLMHCVSAYPAPAEAMNLRAIRRMEESFGVPCGLSDHSVSVSMGSWAVAAGAGAVEKHFTMSRSAAGPDHRTSLEPASLARYIARIRNVERAMGCGSLGMQAVEREVRTVASRSVIAGQAMARGTVVTRGMLAIRRPGTGIPAVELDDVVGRRVLRDVAADTVLTWEMLS